MSFKIARFFHWLQILILGVFLLILGIIGLALPWFPILQTKMIQVITKEKILLSLFGLGLALIGLSVLIYTFLRIRHRYAYIRTGNYSVMIDENLIQQYLDSYWKSHFHQSIPSFLAIKKRSIHITVDLPALSQEEQKHFLEQVKHDLNDIFGRLLGYPHQVYLTARFQIASS